MDLGPKRSRGVLLLARGQLDGHHDVRLHLNEGTTRLPGHPPAPPLLRAHVPAVRDDEGGVLAGLERHLVRRAPPDDELYPALAEGPFHVRQPLQHKGVVAEVRLGVVVGEAEDDEQALSEVVGPPDRVLQGVVVVGALGGLHPVEHVVAVSHPRLVEVLDTLFLGLAGRHASPLRLEPPVARTGA